MKVYLKALGCRLNEAELEQWSQQFRAAGHTLVTAGSEADVLILNTCAVTQDAASKSRRLLHRLYRENPAARLVVSGCYATLQPEQVQDYLGVDMVVPNSQKDQLPQQVIQAFAAPVMPAMAAEPGETALFLRGRHRAFIKIQDGCRYRCTFCIVTVARGEERSRSERDIITEVNRLHDQGVQEIVLTGVHVGGYGSDTGSSLSGLVQALLRETDMPRIRFASVEPWDLPEDFFGLFDNSRLMPHMHLPLQSGADSVLRRMARRCKTADFAKLVAQARASISGFGVTTDIIVGFPGETEAEWQETLAYVKAIGFGHLHIFTYSPRQGTKAAQLPAPVPDVVKRQRSQQLHELGQQMKQAWLQQQLGKSVPVLWEYAREQASGQKVYTGHTPNYCKVMLTVADNKPLGNTIVMTRLDGMAADDAALYGSLFHEN